MRTITKDKVRVFFGDKSTSIINSYGEYDVSVAHRLLEDKNLLDLSLVQQVHGTRGIQVTSTTDSTSTYTREKADFLVTDQVGRGLAVFTGDCLPVVFYDTRHQVIANVHAGWRGLYNDILGQTLDLMFKSYKTVPCDLELFFGPSAGICCYQVQAGFEERMKQKYNFKNLFRYQNGAIYFSCSMLAYCQLVERGIRTDAIDQSNNECTICNFSYNSFRREGAMAGRQISYVVLK